MPSYDRTVRASRLVQLLLVLQRRGRTTAARAGGRARGVGAHRLPRRRGAQRVGRPDLRRERSGRRHRAGRRLRDPAHRTDRSRGDGARPRRRPQRRRRPRPRVGCWSPPSRRSTPPSRPSCEHAPPGCASASSSTSPGWFQAPETGAGARRSRHGPVGRATDRHPLPARATASCRRRLDPLGLVLKGSIWYLVALAHRPAGVRTFHVSRVAHGLPCATSPRRVPPTSTWRRRGPTSGVVRPRPAPLRRPRPRRRRPAVAAAPRPARAVGGGRPWTAPVHPVPTVAARSTIHSESLEIAHDELLRVGRALEVIDPLDLRHAIAATGRALAAHHQG